MKWDVIETDLDREGDKWIVVVHISLENILAGAQDAFEAVSVQPDTFQSRPGSDGGRAGTVVQKRDFTEIVAENFDEENLFFSP